MVGGSSLKRKHKGHAKFIIITGGVLSGLGKGVTAASIGNLLSSKLRVIPIKLDGYLNTDPGTMNPIEHGEVFVLDDGGEVDMDFGHYERFLGVTCKSNWNLTMGKVFAEMRSKERRGDYLGQTVQYIPHVVDLIKDKFHEIAEEEKADILLIEVGGTVGDIENELYIEAVRRLKKDLGPQDIVYVHLTYIPVPTGVNEQKSKPTQQSVKLLKERGIQPDIIIGRCSAMLEPKIRKKIAMFSDVDESAVVTGLDVDNVYKIPIVLEKEGLNEILHKKLGIYSPPSLKNWERLLENLESPSKELTIAICGKYTALEDSYASIIEALKHASAHFGVTTKLKWIETTDIEDARPLPDLMKGVDGIIVPGGFGSRGTEGKIKVIEYVRKNNIPFLGICLGLQLAVVEFARDVCGLNDAGSTEICESTHPVIDILPGQKEIVDKGATMRLGAYKAILRYPGTIKKLYGEDIVWERHRHRYEVNPEYHKILQQNGMIFAGMSEDQQLVEFIELSGHPYFVATQAHPELKSCLTKPAPLFYGLIRAAVERA